MTDMNLYLATSEPGCAWALVLLQTTGDFLVLTHRGLRSVPKGSTRVIDPDHPDYARADEVWQIAFGALRLASLSMPAPIAATAPATTTPAAAAPRRRTREPPASPKRRLQTREQRLGAMRRVLRTGSRSLPELARDVGVSPSYARDLFGTLMEAGEGRQVGDQCELVPAAKRNFSTSLERVRTVLQKGPMSFVEVSRATGISATYSRRLALHLVELGEAQQVDGKIELGSQ